MCMLRFVQGGALKSGFGFPAFSGIARLTWLVDLFGELSVSAATLEEDSTTSYSKMTAKLLTSDNRYSECIDLHVGCISVFPLLVFWTMRQPLYRTNYPKCQQIRLRTRAELWRMGAGQKLQIWFSWIISGQFIVFGCDWLNVWFFWGCTCIIICIKTCVVLTQMYHNIIIKGFF